MSGGKGGKSQIVGYRYSMAIHMGIARGPIDALLGIRVGDLEAWAGTLTTTDYATIDEPNLFGGDDKEGGIKGTFKLFLGQADQVVDAELADQIEGGDPIPGWRGVSTLLYYGQVGSNNPYPKAWKLKVRRALKGWDNDYCWNSDYAKIILNDTNTVTLTFLENPKDKDYLTINDIRVNFRTNPGDTDVFIGDTVDATVTNFVDAVNFYTDELGGVTAAGTGNQVELFGDPTPVVTTPTANIVITSDGTGSIEAMNPAHILYECVTNKIWGRGLPAALIDDDSFSTAAATLYDEGFGLCLMWNRQDDIDQFIKLVCDHIGAALYIDRQTGLLTLKLIRADYDTDNLPVFDFSNGLLDIVNDEISSSQTTYNEIIVSYNDPYLDKVGEVRVQNLASYQALGTIISNKVEYLGLATSQLALRVAQRDLEINSSELRRFKLKFSRAGWQIAPAGVFAIHAPSRGIDKIILRAGAIEDSSLADGTITIDAIQDVFSLPETSFIEPQPSGWIPPDKTPRIISTRLVTELTYVDTSILVSSAELPNVLADNGGVKIFAAQPNGTSVDYEVWSRAAGEGTIALRSVGGWDATSELTDAIGFYDIDIPIDSVPLDVTVGDTVYIDDEYMKLIAINPDHTITVFRGCIDTLPASHLKGATVWYQSYNPTSDLREYSIGETVYVVLLTRTTSAILDASLAPIDEVHIVARQGKPYPPGDMRVNGEPVYTPPHIAPDDIIFTWAHRDRIVQGDVLQGHFAGSMGPEPGTTYTVRVYDEPGTTVIRTVSGITGTTFDYTNGMAMADGDLRAMWFEIEATRDGFVSWQRYRFKVSRVIGFDQDFDYSFDGSF